MSVPRHVEDLFLFSWRTRAHRRHAEWLLGSSVADYGSVPDTLTLRTCMRLEVLSAVPPALPPGAPRPEVRTGDGALSHLFAVAAGLDSPVPGETAIQSQVREVLLEKECVAGFRGSLYHRILMGMLRCGKAVRSQTALGATGGSWGGRVLKCLNSLSAADSAPARPRSALILGSGALASEVSRNLHGAGFQLSIYGRHMDRVIAMSRGIPFIPVGEAALPGAFGDHDAIISCAAPDEPWWDAHRDGLNPPKNSRRFFLDLSSPRSLDPALSARPGVTLMDLSNLPSCDAHEVLLEEARALVARQVQAFQEDEHRRRAWRHPQPLAQPAS